MILSFKGHTPQIATNCFIAPDSWIIGEVDLGSEVSVYFGSVLRGDILPIKVGNKSNIQEHVVIHTSRRRTPTIIGEETTIGHKAMIHSARIGNRVLIGMGSIILDEADIGDESIVGAGAVVTPGKKFPARSLLLGTPAKVVRSVTKKEIDYTIESSATYSARGKAYREQLALQSINS